MIKLGLTGGIASGKSLAAQRLEELGAHIIDCDIVSREVVASGSIGAEKVLKAFGADYFFSDGSLNRAKLSETVFNDSQKLELLNSLLHPLVIAEVEQRMSDLMGAKIVVVVVPLLFESEMESLFDFVWTIGASEVARIKRVKSRDNKTDEIIKNILAHQLTDAQRAALADTVINNNGDREEFLAAIDNEFFKLVR